MIHYIDLLGFFLIVLALFMQWQIYVTRVIVTFATASMLIAAALLYSGLVSGRLPVVILAALTAVVRGITIPAIVVRGLHAKPHRVREQKPVLPIATSIVVSLALVLGSYAIYNLGLRSAVGAQAGFLPLALFLQGGFLIVTRRNAFIQLAGYLSMENAVLLLGSLVLPGFPFIVEGGVILDLVGVVVVSRIIMRLRESGQSGEDHRHGELFG